MTSVAIIVLSGSSAAATSTKTVATTPGVIVVRVRRSRYGAQVIGPASPACSAATHAAHCVGDPALFAHPLAEGDVHSQALEGLGDGALTDLDGMAREERLDLCGELRLATQARDVAHDPRVGDLGEAVEDLLPCPLDLLPHRRAACPVREQRVDEMRSVLPSHLGHRKIEAPDRQLDVGEGAEGHEVAPLLLWRRGVAVAVEHLFVVAGAHRDRDHRE